MILPWRVDVPEERRPWMNWLLILGCIGVFVLQVRDAIHRAPARPPQQPQGYNYPIEGPRTLPDPNAETPAADGMSPSPGITQPFVLDGWGLKGLLGYMWLHGGLFHLLGNMWFLWIFGNAVCAKIGNIRYLLLYVFFGVAAGIVHLLTTPGGAIGASGAIFGVVGMYLVLFFENRITCYFFFWLILPIIRPFTVGSILMILFWLAWNIYGAFSSGGGSHTAYFAHLGGFGTGFAVAWLMCRQGWITMERYERSLWQVWEEHKQGRTRPAFDPALDRLGPEAESAETPEPKSIPLPPELARPVPYLNLDNGSVLPTADLIGATCLCGKTVKASRQYAGKVVRCPACGDALMMPESIQPARPRRPSRAPRPDGFIRFACSCGKRIKVPERHAGHWGKCPQCGSKVRIPASAGACRAREE